QKISLRANSKALEFETKVDWKECHRRLGTAFPIRVQTDSATCDIQYGHLKRPTHRNTTWDMARFEVAAQKYVDLSDQQRGVALLNDCKYGHKLHDNVINLHLLRSPTQPDPDADLGTYQFC
ncbi:MAG: alpha-mannosidase 2c1, partial [SAR324 cluster bacterium]|nr:alpha-mannosidase 2c1 [SAR324 cluster bacterium]